MLGADLTSAHPDQLVFTSGGTESNNLALTGLTTPGSGQLVLSPVEHPSIAGVAEQLERQGTDVSHLKVDSNGVIDLEHLRELLERPTQLVSVMLANHETGVIQPIQEVAEICRAKNVPCHTDAIQAVGKIPVNFRDLGVSALTFNAHKLHGPQGIGGLILHPDLQLQPMLFGGFQQMGLRPGTESVALAVGLRRALELWIDESSIRIKQMTDLRDRLEATICDAVPNIVVNGKSADRLPHTTNLSLPGLDRQALVMALDMAGIACSAGSACASGSSEPSPTLLAMGLDKSVVDAAIRLSVGALTSVDEIDEAGRRITRVFKDLTRQNRTTDFA